MTGRHAPDGFSCQVVHTARQCLIPVVEPQAPASLSMAQTPVGSVPPCEQLPRHRDSQRMLGAGGYTGQLSTCKSASPGSASIRFMTPHTALLILAPPGEQLLTRAYSQRVISTGCHAGHSRISAGQPVQA